MCLRQDTWMASTVSAMRQIMPRFTVTREGERLHTSRPVTVHAIVYPFVELAGPVLDQAVRGRFLSAMCARNMHAHEDGSPARADDDRALRDRLAVEAAL